MPVKLKHRVPELVTADDTSGGAGDGITMGLVVNKDVIKTMVQTYRTEHAAEPNSLNFIHYNLMELFQLFIDNEVIDSTTAISDQMADLQSRGFKIYLGNHYDLSTCPENPDPTQPNPYLHMDTAIVCNTRLDVASRTWVDQLKSDQNSVTILGAGDGLDRGAICPPNCPTVPPSVDSDGYYQTDILP